MSDTDNTATKIYSNIYADVFARYENLKDPNIRLSHYTSAENALNIINNKEFWLRNCRTMNDYMELDHGIDILDTYLRNNGNKQKWDDLLKIKYQIDITIVDLFNKYWKNYKDQIYVSCFSEHHIEQDSRGRLSMWRAYSGKSTGLALVFNGAVFSDSNNEFPGSMLPIFYDGVTSVCRRMDLLYIALNEELSENLIKKEVFEKEWAFFYPMLLNCMHTKHPGFAEEKEWRLIYCPEFSEDEQDIFRQNVKIINGIPQIVYSIEMKDYPLYALSGTNPNDLIYQIIVGPTDNGEVIMGALRIALASAGVSDPEARIRFSDIPLRS